jgi:hypothetical protein
MKTSTKVKPAADIKKVLQKKIAMVSMDAIKHLKLADSKKIKETVKDASKAIVKVVVKALKEKEKKIKEKNKKILTKKVRIAAKPVSKTVKRIISNTVKSIKK